MDSFRDQKPISRRNFIKFPLQIGGSYLALAFFNKVFAQMIPHAMWRKKSAGGGGGYALHAWGNGGFGALGDGTTADKSAPVSIGALSWSSLACGDRFSVGVTSTGALYSWGLNNYGQLGDGTTGNKSAPAQVGALTNWQSVAAGSDTLTEGFVLAVKTDGTLWTWGGNSAGQLGDGSTTARSSPVQVGALTDWQNVAAGFSHSVATKTDGTLWTWGSNGSGQLGDGSTTSLSSPTQVGALTTWGIIAAGENFTMSLKGNQSLWAWGANAWGQLGDGATSSYSSPVQIGALTDWSYIACGRFHTLAVKSDNSLWTWGRNNAGQLGDGSTSPRSSPVQVGAAAWGKVAAGWSYSMAITKGVTSELYGFGQNTSGQLGDNSTSARSTPTQVGADTTWTIVACGASNGHTLATK